MTSTDHRRSTPRTDRYATVRLLLAELPPLAPETGRDLVAGAVDGCRVKGTVAGLRSCAAEAAGVPGVGRRHGGGGYIGSYCSRRGVRNPHVLEVSTLGGKPVDLSFDDSADFQNPGGGPASRSSPS